MINGNRLDFRSARELENLVEQVEAASARLLDALTRNGFAADLSPISDILSSVKTELNERLNRNFEAALVRVNLRNETYELIRVIDGDTLVVAPPEELSGWVKDIHVRLYGIDTPEMHDETGPIYKRLLEHICSKKDIQIIWERERPGTSYEGFPRSSFERGVGHIFLNLGPRPHYFRSHSKEHTEEYVLYVNAVLASLPHAQLQRGGKSLLIGARFLSKLKEGTLEWSDFHPKDNSWLMPLWPGHVSTDAEFTQLVGDSLGRWKPIWRRYYRFGFPWVYPRQMIIESINGSQRLTYLLNESLMACGCQTCIRLSEFMSKEWLCLCEEAKASVFDPLLYLAGHVSEWWDHGRVPA